MEGSGSGSGSGGWFLSGSDMEMSMPKRQQGQMGQPLTHQPNHFPPLNMVGGLEHENPLGFGEAKELTTTLGALGKGKGISLGPSCSNNTTSDDEEPSFTDDVNGDNCNASKKKLRWQRMKWTDDVIKLLIAVVASVGDDALHEAADGPNKRKFGLLHKKGKWKMVSNIMISKGCCVSPQQCEDKFNDLNKRYKKLNDILGCGISCQVVENPSLMDTMPQLTNKAKDEVRKILSSKHLFYQEMCAYHNGKLIPGCHDVDLQGHVSTQDVHSNGNDISEGDRIHESDDNDDVDDDDVSYGNDPEANGESITAFGIKGSLNEGNSAFSPLPDREGGDRVQLAAMFPDVVTSPAEQRAWIQQQLQESEEEKVRLLAEALDLEKQHFKWLRFRSKKDRELERVRLENQKMKLDIDEMLLVLKQKALHLGILNSETPPER